MNDSQLRVWDGKRPLLSRAIVERRQMEVGTLGIVSATETLAQATDWCFAEAHHSIVVHLGGRLDRMECEFSQGPSGRTLPAAGDIWMIPAQCRYAALAQGDHARFVEFRLPTSWLKDAPLNARVGHRDPFIHAAASRMADLMARPDDDLAVMALHAMAEALKLHMMDLYGRQGRSGSDGALSQADRALLSAAIRDQLDARHSLASLASLVGMDVRRFTDAFREAFGDTPWHYVLTMRLEEAARQMLATTRPVTDIALQLGFATPSHFSTAFARHFGVPPSRYRAIGGRTV
jgi:AraC family transcriptional regulator